MSNVAALPVLQANGSVAAGEDLAFSLAFTLADGTTPLDLTGIAFTLEIKSTSGASLFSGSTGDSTLAISGVGVNVLSCEIPFATVSAWAPGGYSLNLIATDTVITKGVFADSSLFVGETGAWTFTPIAASSAIAAPAPPVGTVAGTIIEVSTSMTISNAGTYVLMQGGLTLTLASPAAVPGPVIVKDFTGASAAATIIGAIDGATSLAISTPYQSATLLPLPSLNAWARVA